MANKKKVNNVCTFCNKSFVKECTLQAHICVKKKRFIEKDIPERRIAFNAFIRFYELCSPSKKQKTLDDFINSKLYADFYKFGRFIYLLNPIYPDKYIDFVILSGTKITEWISDKVYDLYLEDLMKKEPVERALERSFIALSEWETETNNSVSDFFEASSGGDITYYIKSGKISPWLIYASDAGSAALGKLNNEQLQILNGIINPDFWISKLKKDSEGYKFANDFLKSVGF